jgi:hypothetical protein
MEDLMVKLAAFIIVCLCFFIFMKTYWIWYLNQARKKGVYPTQGKATLFDVRRLLIEGEKDLAIRVYCEIFGSNQQEARKAIEELEKSLKG